MKDPADLDAKRLEAFAAPRKHPGGPGRGRKVKMAGSIDYGPAGGPGWGGAAKGKGKDLSDPAVHAARVAERRRMTPAEVEALVANKAALADEALAVIATIMRDSEYEVTRLNAAAKMRAEVVGAPMQRVMRAETTPENLVDQLEIEALTPEQRDALRDIANALLERRTSSLPGPADSKS